MNQRKIAMSASGYLDYATAFFVNNYFRRFHLNTTDIDVFVDDFTCGVEDGFDTHGFQVPVLSREEVIELRPHDIRHVSQIVRRILRRSIGSRKSNLIGRKLIGYKLLNMLYTDKIVSFIRITALMREVRKLRQQLKKQRDDVMTVLNQ
jgi:hypothetical protein